MKSKLKNLIRYLIKPLLSPYGKTGLVLSGPAFGQKFLITKTSGYHSFNVSTITLDHFVYNLGNPPPNIIKIDVEGAGALVLEGASKLLMKERPAFIIELYSIREAVGIGKIMSEYNYLCCKKNYSLWDGKSYTIFIVCWHADFNRPLI